MCLAHASKEESEAAFSVINENGVVDVRGVPLTSALLSRVLATAPRGGRGRAVLEAARFDGAAFTGLAHCGEATFTRTVAIVV